MHSRMYAKDYVCVFCRSLNRYFSVFYRPSLLNRYFSDFGHFYANDCICVFSPRSKS